MVENDYDYISNTIGRWIVEQNEYFLILKKPLEPNRKTNEYEIYNINTKNLLGIVKWYGAWRKFCFFPSAETIWDDKCLSVLNSFIINLNKDYRKEKKNV